MTLCCGDVNRPKARVAGPGHTIWLSHRYLVTVRAGWSPALLALTDTGALYGAAVFGRACQAAGVAPIIGLVIPVATPAGDAPVGTEAPGELVLLAQNPAGYRSLCRLATLLQAEQERERWRQTGLPWRHLQENEAGLLCLNSGRRGWLEQYLRAGEGGAASRIGTLVISYNKPRVV